MALNHKITTRIRARETLAANMAMSEAIELEVTTGTDSSDLSQREQSNSVIGFAT